MVSILLKPGWEQDGKEEGPKLSVATGVRTVLSALSR
jgi:hypothetical protein